ncbi:MAG: type II secretion system protein GspC [Pseudomonadota bacterium]
MTYLGLLLACAMLADLTWKWVYTPDPSAAVPPVMQNTAENKPAKLINVSTISNQHLFGAASGQPVEDAPIQETRLKLELRGVVATGKVGGAAIIGDPSGGENYYRVGDILPGNARLHEVHPHQVLLERGGRYETLSLPQAQDSGAGGTPSGPESYEAPPPEAQPPPEVTGASPEAPQLLKQYRQTLASKPESLMNLVQAVPVMRGGQLSGYRIGHGRDQTVLGKFGLRPGDIVTSVNGVALNDPANGLSVLKKLTTADELSLQIERNGVSQSMVFRAE